MENAKDVEFQGTVDVQNIGGDFILNVRLGGSNVGIPLAYCLASVELLAVLNTFSAEAKKALAPGSSATFMDLVALLSKHRKLADGAISRTKGVR